MNDPEFIGDLKTLWLPNGRDMVVLERFGYRDENNEWWWCEPGDVINGASIPRFAWSLIGSPYVGKYRRATALHDSGYIHRDPRGRKAVDKMMLSASKTDGVWLLKRRAMYRTVRLFGQHAWETDDVLDIMEGEETCQRLIRKEN